MRAALFAGGLAAGLAGPGCGNLDPITVSGVVYSSHDPLSPPLPGAELRFVDFDLAELGTATADADGAFALSLPAGVSVLVAISAEGNATTTFPGVLGVGDQEVEDHAMYGFPLADEADLRARFAGCPGADAGGAMVYGEIRVYGLSDPDGQEPSTNVGTAKVDTGDAQIFGCYFDAAGELYDPEAAFTGDSGQFAVFGVEPGLHDLLIDADLTPGQDSTVSYPLWVPDAPTVVSPWFPAYVELL